MATNKRIDLEKYNAEMKQAYYDGRKAATNDRETSDNPFPPDSDLHKNWLFGYKAAARA